VPSGYSRFPWREYTKYTTESEEHMSVKIKLHVGDIDVEYEGNEDFLLKQLPGLVKQLRPLAIKNCNGQTEAQPSTGGSGDSDVGSLASFLKKTNSRDRQVDKFLATAEWLHRKKGINRLGTGDVVEALSENSQGNLTNPSVCLAANVKKGCCQKENGKFYVLPEGRKHLGLSDE